eukprot:gene15658-33081_t
MRSICHHQLAQAATRPREKNTAENMLVKMPMQCTTAKPRTGPEPKASSASPAIKVVTLESRIVAQARSYPAWMAACGEPGEDAALYATVKAVGMELCPALGISIPVGKDSLSMRTQWKDEGKDKKVTSPVSLIVSGFATLQDVRGTLTPQLNATDDTTLVLVDLGKGQHRMAASILAQTLDQTGDTVPDLDDAKDLVNLVNAVNALRAKGQVLAYHDRGDGGLLGGNAFDLTADLRDALLALLDGLRAGFAMGGEKAGLPLCHFGHVRARLGKCHQNGWKDHGRSIVALCLQPRPPR